MGRECTAFLEICGQKICHDMTKNDSGWWILAKTNSSELHYLKVYIDSIINK